MSKEGAVIIEILGDSKKFMKSLGELSGKAIKTLTVGVGGAMAGLTAGMLSVESATREYRESQAKSNTAMEMAGFSAEQASKQYKEFYAIMGETDTATEATQLLSKLAKTEDDLASWTTITTGVMAEFGDSLPLESLVEASNETAKVGKVTGTLADALNWAGVSEDDFNAKLATCATETERTALITDTLNGLYEDSAEAYRKNNAEIIEANKNQAELQSITAGLGDAILGIKNDITTALLPTLKLATEEGTAWITTLQNAFATGGFAGMAGAMGTVLADMVTQLVSYAPLMIDAGVGLLSNLILGVQSRMPEMAQDVTGVFASLIQGILTVLPQFVSVGIQMVGQLILGIGKALPDLMISAVRAVENLAYSFIDNIPLLIEAALALVGGLIQGLVQGIPALIVAVPGIILSLVSAILENIPFIAQTGITLITALVDGIETIIDTVIAVVPEILDGLITTILDNLPQIVETGITLLVALVQALPEIIAAITQVIPRLVTAISDAILERLDDIVIAGVKLLVALVQDLPSVLWEVLKAVDSIVDAIVGGFADSIGSVIGIGVDLVKGIWEGITSMASWLGGKISGFFDGVVDGAKEVLGIHSPSKVFAEVVGAPTAQGFFMGFDDEMAGLSQKMQNAVTAEVNKVGVQAAVEAESSVSRTDGDPKPQSGGGDGDNREITVNFEGSLAQLGRVLKPVIAEEDKRQGTSLVKKGGS